MKNCENNFLIKVLVKIRAKLEARAQKPAGEKLYNKLLLLLGRIVFALLATLSLTRSTKWDFNRGLNKNKNLKECLVSYKTIFLLFLKKLADLLGLKFLELYNTQY